MNLSRKSVLLGIMILLFLVVSGCGIESAPINGTDEISTNTINPIEKDKVVEIQVNNGSYIEKITDTNMINRIVNNLNNVKVKQLGRDEEKKVLDNGNALKKESTITLTFLQDGNNEPLSIAILLSNKQLYMPDMKSMQSDSYTISYLNDSDKTSLKSIQEMYSIIEEVLKK